MIPLVDPITQAKRYAALVGSILGLVLVTCLALYVWGMQRKVDRLEAAAVISTADIAAAEVHRSGTAAVSNQRNEAKDETKEALDRSPEYRDAVVPSDVADRLRKRTDAK